MKKISAKKSSGVIAKNKRKNGRMTKRARNAVLQKTLKNPIHCTGTALHSGAKVAMTLHPAEPDSGIVFRRADISGCGALIPANWRHVSDTRLCTTLRVDSGATVATVEHLMAALAGSGIDNLVIEIHGSEVPAMDGSAAPFVFLIECAGVVEQEAPRRAIRVLKTVSVSDGKCLASLSPAREFSVHCEIDFDSGAISHQEYLFYLVNGTFKTEISRARTFGFLHEVDHLRASGLVLGGSMDNAVVVSGDRILNDDGLRFEDEFVRHKVLDSIGDLYLAGAQLIGHFHGVHSGHSLNHLLLEEFFSDEDAWRLCDMEPLLPSRRRTTVGEPPLAASA